MPFYDTHQLVPAVGGYVARGQFILAEPGVVLFNQDLAGPHVEVNMGDRGHLNLTAEQAEQLHDALARVLPPKRKMLPEIQLGSGRYFNFIDPGLYGLYPVDIAHGLARQSRYSGHTADHLPVYTIAQHCVLASYNVDAQFAFEALMHDASEALTGDCSSPLKQLLREWKLLENHIEAWLAQEYGTPVPMSPEVKVVDLILLATEKRDLMPKGYAATDVTHGAWTMLDGVQPLGEPLEDVWSSHVAKRAWLRRFYELAPAAIAEKFAPGSHLMAQPTEAERTRAARRAQAAEDAKSPILVKAADIGAQIKLHDLKRTSEAGLSDNALDTLGAYNAAHWAGPRVG